MNMTDDARAAAKGRAAFAVRDRTSDADSCGHPARPLRRVEAFRLIEGVPNVERRAGERRSPRAPLTRARDAANEEGRNLDDLYAYLSDLRGHLLAVLSAGPFLIDRLITWFWPSGRKWLDNFPHRRSLFLWIIVGGTFYAGFLAWREEYYRRQNAERSLELAKSSLDLATQASADLKFNGITLNKDPRNGLNYFNIEVINSGPLTGTNVVIKTEGTLSDHTLTKGETDLWLAKLYKEVDDADKSELSSDQLHSNDKSIFTITNVTPTDEQLSAIDKATLSLYVFVVARYEDRNVQGNSYYTMQFCGYFIATRKYWHNCAPNKTTKTVGSRAK